MEADEGLNCLGLDYAHYLCDRLYNSSADDIGSAECSDYDYCMIIDCQRNENND